MSGGDSSDYLAKHDLGRLFSELKETLAKYQPDRPLGKAIIALQKLDSRREEGASVSNYKEIFEQVIKPTNGNNNNSLTPNRAFHSPYEEDFNNFAWSGAESDADNTARINALAEAGSEEGWSESVKERMAASISAGPALATDGPVQRGRRLSISAEPYNPSENKQFHRVVISKSDESRKRIEAAVKDNLLFRNLDAEPLNQIIDAMFEKNVPKDVELIKQGDEGDYFYVVNSGSFQVIKDGKAIVQYGSGDTFGELALMYGSPRMASVKSLTDSIVWAVDRATFRGIVIDLAFRKRRLYETFLRSVPLLQTLHDNEIFRICDALQPVYFSVNQVIVRQGEIGQQFYIIEEGTAIATMQKESDDASQKVTVATYGKGNYFGELALLRDAPRAATVTAQTAIKCVTLTKADFIRLLGPLMPLLQRNQQQYQTYEQYL